MELSEKSHADIKEKERQRFWNKWNKEKEAV